MPASLPAPTTAAGLADALRYPLRGAALAANVLITFGHGIASLLFAIFGLPLHIVFWLAFWKYALEVLAATGGGRDAPPEVLSHIDDAVHTRHVMLQMALLVAVSLSSVLLPAPWSLLFVLAIAALLPGLVIALTVAQNLTMALNPLNWLAVAGQLGIGYPLLVLAVLAAFALQLAGRDWLGAEPGWRVPLYYVALQHLWLATFRLIGLALRRHAQALDYQVDAVGRPTLARDREAAELARLLARARGCDDADQRIRLLAEVLGRDSHDDVHRAYREALRAAGRRQTLGEHAAVRTAELVVTDRIRPALALVAEALADDAAFTPSDGDVVRRLVESGRGLGMLRQSAQLAHNYCVRYPRRRDMQPLALLAAELHAALNEPGQAHALLALAEQHASGEQEVDAVAAARQALAR